jgi:HPt (histidine-containing phosphotransfer) domain-containing protein
MTAVKLSLCDALEDKDLPANLKSLSAALSFITEKWTSLIDQTHEAISETDVPDGTDLRLLRVMTKRKHMFSEIRRTLAGVAQSITAPELSKARYSLEKVTKKLDDWVRDLESTISLCSSYLSLDESQRAITQSTRTAQLTVLAFVFIPVSTVASTFGMNVNVLKDNPPIYWFAGIGAVVALITFLYATFFQHINRGLALGGLYSSSLALDVIFLIVKVLGALISFVVITLTSPFWVFGYFMLHHEPKNVWIGAFTGIIDALWYMMFLYWDFGVRIFEWSPLALDMRLEWRARRTLPEVGRLRNELGFTERKTDQEYGNCIVM